MLENVVSLKAMKFEWVNAGGIVTFIPDMTINGCIREIRVAYTDINDALYCMTSMLERCSRIRHNLSVEPLMNLKSYLNTYHGEKAAAMTIRFDNDTMNAEIDSIRLTLTSIEQLTEVIRMRPATYHALPAYRYSNQMSQLRI